MSLILIILLKEFFLVSGPFPAKSCLLLSSSIHSLGFSSDITSSSRKPSLTSTSRLSLVPLLGFYIPVLPHHNTASLGSSPQPGCECLEGRDQFCLITESGTQHVLSVCLTEWMNGWIKVNVKYWLKLQALCGPQHRAGHPMDTYESLWNGWKPRTTP